jgi:hypothetical protein
VNRPQIPRGYQYRHERQFTGADDIALRTEVESIREPISQLRRSRPRVLGPMSHCCHHGTVQLAGASQLEH